MSLNALKKRNGLGFSKVARMERRLEKVEVRETGFACNVAGVETKKLIEDLED
jgi:hypothetical protein